jgi:hypothetical protein
VFGGLGCNGGVPIPLNPLRNEPYLRALVQGMARGRLPASRRFALRPGPATVPGFNGLPGLRVPVPRVDRDGQPVGGVRFPEVELPLGRLEPVSIPPAVTTGLAQVCGNSGGYTPFTSAEIARRYSRAAYLAGYRRALARLQRARLVSRSERAAMLAAADAGYRAAVAPAP